MSFRSRMVAGVFAVLLAVAAIITSVGFPKLDGRAAVAADDPHGAFDSGDLIMATRTGAVHLGS